MTGSTILAALRGEIGQTTVPGHCAVHGEFVIRQFLGSDGSVVGELSRCAQCAEDARAADEKSRQAEDRRKRFADADVPLRFRSCTFSSFDPARAGEQAPVAATVCDEVRSYARGLPGHLKTGRSIALIGSTGTAKTHLAVAALKLAILQGLTARYATVGDMIATIRGTWDRDGDLTEAQARALFQTPDLLVLDEIGAEQKGSDHELGLLAGIIDHRYRNLRPTIFVSNVGLPELRKYLGERVLSRLMDNGGRVLTFRWQDHRANGARR